MREAQFLKQNSEHWKAFEKRLQMGEGHNPDEFAQLFIRLQDDLSYARTFYPQSETAKYLNELASLAYQKIYRNKREKKNRFFTFWKEEVPFAAYQLRKPFLYSLLIFLVSVAMGALSLSKDDTFARLVLGDGYVNMTLENIKNGDPMGVYKDAPPFAMFLFIAVNNLYVAIKCFASGMIFSVGSGYMLFTNGVMLGVFQYFFQMHNLLIQSALTIWIHGTLEISAIVLAGGCGLALGNSILFPGTYSRLYSLRNAMVNGIKIIVSLFPVFITAAFLEGFVTRHTEMPVWLSISIIASSLAFIIYYYIYLPHKLFKKTYEAKPGSIRMA